MHGHGKAFPENTGRKMKGKKSAGRVTKLDVKKVDPKRGVAAKDSRTTRHSLKTDSHGARKMENIDDSIDFDLVGFDLVGFDLIDFDLEILGIDREDLKLDLKDFDLAKLKDSDEDPLRGKTTLPYRWPTSKKHPEDVG